MLKLLAPLTPHLAEELWEHLGHTTSIHLEEWPEYDESKLVSDTVSIVVQINGKTRGNVEVATDTPEDGVLEQIRADEKFSKYLGEGEPKKVVYVPNRLINLVV